MTDEEHQSDLRARIAYLEAALEPGSEINSQTTFYYGKGESMRQELAKLRAQLTKALREDVRRYESDLRDLADDD